jgi:uncharacterized membrane protein
MDSALLHALHVLGAAIWVGGMFFALLVLRPSLAVLEPPQRLALHMQVFRRFFLVVWHAMPLVIASGYALVFTRHGGFAASAPALLVMHALGWIMALVFLVIFFVHWRRLRGGDRAALDAIRRLIAVNLVLGCAAIAAGAFI